MVLSDQRPTSGFDSIGVYSGEETDWVPPNTFFHTSYRLYDTNDIIVFKQEFKNRNEVIIKAFVIEVMCIKLGFFIKDINGTGLSILLDRAISDISSSYPSLVPNLSGSERGFWTYGGRMSGTPCISIGRYGNFNLLL